jgi:sugar transferase EpsL
MKRAFDVVAAAAALAMLAVPMLAIAGAVRVCLGRPVLFTQLRPGRHGIPFRLIKFRTMREAVDAERRPLPDDERLTRLGQWLRAASLDELPELWNVLRGDMSLVGPRADIVEQVANYEPHERRRLAVRPGITGWAQVNGRDAIPWEKRFELDVWYIEHWSLLLDLKILLMTVAQLLRPRPEPVRDDLNIRRAKAR